MNDYSFYYFSIDGIFGIWPEDRGQERRYHGRGSIYLTVNCKAIFWRELWWNLRWIHR